MLMLGVSVWKHDRYLDALSQLLNERHMLVKHRLQTEDLLTGEEQDKDHKDRTGDTGMMVCVTGSRKIILQKYCESKTCENVTIGKWTVEIYSIF